MNMMRTNGLLTVLAAIALTACGGNDSPTSFSASSSGSTGTTSSSGTSSSGSSTSSSGTTTLTYALGNGTGSGFQSGAIGIAGLQSGSLSAGGVAALSLSIVDQTGTLYSGTAVTITISSTCISEGLAIITPTSPTTAGQGANTVSTSTGTAAMTYTAKGCSGSDAITATALVGNTTLTATGTISVAAAAIGSIQFQSASPQSVGLKGTGLAETSTVTFKVLDATGNPRPNAQVSFALSTSVGGITLQPSTATSATDGTVQTVVSAGTQHTTVRVTATIASPALSTQSGVLTVTTGLPASNAFSISVGAPSYFSSGGLACSNVEAYDVDGVTVPITARLADRYNNPAPDGTAVAFTTAGGHVVGSCTTPSAPGAADGTCTVNWTSANPRPSTSGSPPSALNGRARILATAIGEESFTDNNGNGYWDSGEPFVNLGEPYRDDNENNAYEVGEYFLDFNQNGTRDPGDGTFKGITCTGSGSSATCSTTTLAIGAQNIIVMSTSAAVITPTPGSISIPASVSGGATSSAALNIDVVDTNGNPMAAGTTIVATADASIGSVAGPGTNAKIGCQNSGHSSTSVTLTAPTSAGSGVITITVTSPGTGSQTITTVPVTIT